MNIAIYKSLAAKAAELFQRTKIDAGTYSAKELADRKKDKKALCWEMENSKEEITISVESFTCRIVASMVFTFLARFEKLIPEKERVKFTRSEESEILCSLSINVSRDAAKVAKFASKGEKFRKVLNYVYLDIQRGVLVATNDKRLAVRPVNISNIEGEIPENGFYILPKFLKGGSYEIACIKKAGELFTQTTNEAGETTLCPSGLRFPNYRSVIPEGGKTIRVLDVKSFSAFVKQSAKDKSCQLRIETKAGSERISISAVEIWYEKKVLSEIEVELLSPAPCTAVFGFKPAELLPALSGWTGELLVNKSCTCALLGSSIGQTVVMYFETNGYYTPQISDEIEEQCEIQECERELSTIGTKPESKCEAKSNSKESTKICIQNFHRKIENYGSFGSNTIAFPKIVYRIASDILYDLRRDIVTSLPIYRQVNLTTTEYRFFMLQYANGPPYWELFNSFNHSFIIQTFKFKTSCN